MANKNTANACKAASPKARNAYVSFNRDEWAALQKLGYRERWAYMQFKWLANFKTGMVGNFRKQRLTYQALADLVTVPGVQGRGMGNIDDTQAADILDRLVVVGLVKKHPKRANGALMFELPLSPIDRKPSALSAGVAEPTARIDIADLNFPNQTPPEPGFFPDDELPPFDNSPIAMPLPGLPTPSLSVMTLTKLKNNTDEATAADAASPRRATGAATFAENSYHPLPPTAPLTPEQIQNIIAGDWTFSQTDTAESLMLYQSWSCAGLTLVELHEAMSSLDQNLNSIATPVDLAPKLLQFID